MTGGRDLGFGAVSDIIDTCPAYGVAQGLGFANRRSNKRSYLIAPSLSAIGFGSSSGLTPKRVVFNQGPVHANLTY